MHEIFSKKLIHTQTFIFCIVSVVFTRFISCNSAHECSFLICLVFCSLTALAHCVYIHVNYNIFSSTRRPTISYAHQLSSFTWLIARSLLYNIMYYNILHKFGLKKTYVINYNNTHLSNYLGNQLAILI